MMAPPVAEVRRGHLARLQPQGGRTCQMTGTTPSLNGGHQRMAPFAAEVGGGHMARLQHIPNMVNIEEGSKMFTRMRCTRCSETEAYVSNSKTKLLHTPLDFNLYAQSNFIKPLPEVKSGFGTLPKAAMFAGFGLYRKYLYKTAPKLYETDKCQVCKEEGSMECSLHFIFCDGLQLDDKRTLGQLWIPPCDRPAKAGRTQKYGSKAKVKRPSANNTTIRPANKALADLAS